MKKSGSSGRAFKKILLLLTKVDPLFMLTLLLLFYLQLTFLSTLPYLDGNIDFVQMLDFQSGGLQKLALNWASIHPPLKAVLGALFVGIFGVNQIALSLLGITHAVLGVAAIYFLAGKLFGKKTGKLAAFFLAAFPLYFANSLFVMTDFMASVYLLSFLAAYVNGRRLLAVIFLCLGVLTKETFLLFAAIVLFVEVIAFLKRASLRQAQTTHTQGMLLFLIPLLVYLGWSGLLQGYGKEAWSDWIFAKTAGQGAFATIVSNIINFRFVNSYAIQSWLQLFLLNFNWIIWGFTFIAAVIYSWRAPLKSRNRILKSFTSMDEKGRTLLIIFCFGIAYFLLVLSFQTYTIPRYALPLLCLLLVFFAKAVSYIMSLRNTPGKVLLLFMGIIFITALFTSSDPVSKNLWKEQVILGENIYKLNEHGAGNDGIAYNAQYLLISLRRTALINQANSLKKPVISKDCRWLFADVNNDRRIFDYLLLSGIPKEQLCEQK